MTLAIPTSGSVWQGFAEINVGTIDQPLLILNYEMSGVAGKETHGHPIYLHGNCRHSASHLSQQGCR